MYDRTRLIGALVVLLIFLLSTFPVQTLTILAVLFIGYVIYRASFNNHLETQSISRRRKEALEAARIYLAPYTNINGNLRLSNRNCSLSLDYYGNRITGRENGGLKRRLRIIRSNVHAIPDLWDMFCFAFNYQTSFDGLVELCERYNAEIEIENSQNENLDKLNSSIAQNHYTEVKSYKEMALEKLEKIDINNASESEITVLPGVNIVMSKKLIQKREEIGGFKSIDDVVLYLKLKPHLEARIRDVICVKPMKGSIKIQRTQERNIDF